MPRPMGRNAKGKGKGKDGKRRERGNNRDDTSAAAVGIPSRGAWTGVALGRLGLNRRGCAAAPYGCINEVGLNSTWGDRLECASGQSGVWGSGYSGHTGWVAVGACRRRLLQRKIVF